MVVQDLDPLGKRRGPGGRHGNEGNVVGAKRKRKCSICHNTGHIRTNCPEKLATVDFDDDADDLVGSSNPHDDETLSTMPVEGSDDNDSVDDEQEDDDESEPDEDNIDETSETEVASLLLLLNDEAF